MDELRTLGKRTFLVTFCLLMVLSPFYAGSSTVKAHSQSEPRYRGTLRIAYSVDLNSFNSNSQWWSTILVPKCNVKWYDSAVLTSADLKFIHEQLNFQISEITRVNNKPEFTGVGSNSLLTLGDSYIRGTDISTNIERGVYWLRGFSTPPVTITPVITTTNLSEPPVAIISYPENRSRFGQTQAMVFDGSESYDPDGGSITYHWEIDPMIEHWGNPPGHPENRGFFNQRINNPREYTITLTVTDEEGLIDTVSIYLKVSSHMNTAPSVLLIQPNGGELVRSTYEIRWSANDSDWDNLVFNVRYSSDGGQTWTILANGLRITSYTWDISSLETGSNYLIRVEASDGKLTAEDDSDASFTVESELSHKNISRSFFFPGFGLYEALGGLTVLLCIVNRRKRRIM